MSISSPPPPYLTPSQQQSSLLYSNNGVTSTPQSSSTSTSLLIFTIVVSSAIILSASLYILIRFLSRRFRSTAIHPPQLNPNSTSKSSDTDNFFNVLPLFSFRSIAGKVSGGDCAVCLSKFEPDDQLRLLPLCAHAFHADCIDTWLTSNSTCPLCRSTVHSNQSDALNKILPASENRSGSFRIEIGSVSRRRSDAVSGETLRSYAIGSFEYVVDEEHEIPIGDVQTHRREVSDFDKDSIPVTPEEDTAAEVTGERGSWLRDYVDRIATASSRSFRSSGRFFSGSSGRSNAVIDDIEANTRVGEEISEMFRWLSGV